MNRNSSAILTLTGLVVLLVCFANRHRVLTLQIVHAADSHEATLPSFAVSVNTSQSVVSACSEASLDGSYEATLSGFGNPGRAGSATGNASKVPLAAVGVVNLDGHGNVSARFTIAEGGNVSTTALTTPDVGTYTVNGDCTAVIYDNTRGGQFNMVLIGAELKCSESGQIIIRDSWS